MINEHQRQKQSHSLTNTELDWESGLRDKYKEFGNSDFDNIFQPLEKEDYEIRASNLGKEERMKGTRQASYIDQLSSGFDAKTQDDYEAGQGQKGQEGKGHEEEVSPVNWKNDKRDAIGRAATANGLKRMAAKMIKMAEMIEAEEVIDDDIIEDIDSDDEFEEIACGDGALTAAEDEIDEDLSIDASDEGADKTASTENHPMDKPEGNPEANMPSDTGDEWIDIGPGEFSDKRDDIGRAA